MLKKVLINIAIIFLCILGISAEGRAEEWSENNCIEVVSKYYDFLREKEMRFNHLIRNCLFRN